MYCLNSFKSYKPVVPNLGPPDVLGLQLPEAFTTTSAGQDFWEVKSRNIWRPKVGDHCAKQSTPNFLKCFACLRGMDTILLLALTCELTATVVHGTEEGNVLLCLRQAERMDKATFLSFPSLWTRGFQSIWKPV